MEPVGNLDGVGCTPACAVRVGSGTITADHVDTGVLTQPGYQPARRTIWQKIDRAPTLQINQNRSVPLTTSPGPIVDAKYTWRLGRRQRRCAHQTEERGAAGRHAEASPKPRSRTATERESDVLQCRTKGDAVAGAATGESRHLLGEDAPWTSR